jgi:hypothetical protein
MSGDDLLDNIGVQIVNLDIEIQRNFDLMLVKGPLKNKRGRGDLQLES